MCVEIESVLTLPAHCQNSLAPIRRHHDYPRTSLYFFQEHARTVIPTQCTTTISDNDVAVVHNFECSWLMIQFKFVIVAFEPDLVLVDWVVFANWKKGIALRME